MIDKTTASLMRYSEAFLVFWLTWWIVFFIVLPAYQRRRSVKIVALWTTFITILITGVYAALYIFI